jgi:hypothetical protein
MGNAKRGVAMEARKNLTITASGSQRSWLSDWRAIAVCILIISAFLALGGRFLTMQDFRKWLPLLFVLPCVIMMFMCMKGVGGRQGGTRTPNARIDSPGDGA